MITINGNFDKTKASLGNLPVEVVDHLDAIRWKLSEKGSNQQTPCVCVLTTPVSAGRSGLSCVLPAHGSDNNAATSDNNADT